MADDVEITVSLNQQQLELVGRLVQEGGFGDTPAAVLRQVFRLYVMQHPELLDDGPGT
jgi:hypothetical protein